MEMVSMSVKHLLNKQIKIVANDGSSIVVRYGILTSFDEHFLTLRERNGKEILIGLSQVHKIEEVFS